MTRHAEVATSPEVKEAIPALAELAGRSAIRRCATAARSAARSPTTIRLPIIRPACLGLGATIITNKRRIAADEFFKGLFETALEPTRSSPRCSFPMPNKAAYVKFRNPASRYAMVGVFVSKRGSRHARRGHWRRRERCLPRDGDRGGAEEALCAEIARTA